MKQWVKAAVAGASVGVMILAYSLPAAAKEAANTNATVAGPRLGGPKIPVSHNPAHASSRPVPKKNLNPGLGNTVHQVINTPRPRPTLNNTPRPPRNTAANTPRPKKNLTPGLGHTVQQAHSIPRPKRPCTTCART